MIAEFIYTTLVFKFHIITQIVNYLRKSFHANI